MWEIQDSVVSWGFLRISPHFFLCSSKPTKAFKEMFLLFLIFVDLFILFVGYDHILRTKVTDEIWDPFHRDQQPRNWKC